MNWRDRLATIPKGPGGALTKPTKGLLSVMAVGRPALSEPAKGLLSVLSVGGPALSELERLPQRAHLLVLADDEGLPAELVHGLDDADVTACAGLPDEALRAYLRALEADRRMDAGMVPLAWGDAVGRTCEGCGPVLLWPECPDVVKVCPWCFRRKAGKAIPRPLVACGDCRHFLPDTVNPTAGMGGCRLGTGRAYWPMKKHRCADWKLA